MRKLVGWSCASALALLLGAAPASAAPIGVFGLVVDSDLGPIFSVENFSPDGSFSDIVVHLFDGTTDLLDLGLANVDPFGLQQSFDDVTALSFDRATLDLSYSVAGSLTLHELVGLSFAYDPLLQIQDPFDPTQFTVGGFVGTSTSVAIDFEPLPSPQPVPEPASLTLVACGLLGILGARRRTRPAGSVCSTAEPAEFAERNSVVCSAISANSAVCLTSR
jgi:hypothetical protein